MAVPRGFQSSTAAYLVRNQVLSELAVWPQVLALSFQPLYREGALHAPLAAQPLGHMT